MRRPLLTLLLLITFVPLSHADDASLKDVARAVAKSTLNQPGTPPFHLKAESLANDRNKTPAATIEFWWAAPDKYRREVTSADIHQILVVNGSKLSEKNSTDFFPPALQKIADALINPVPYTQNELQQKLKTAKATAMHLPMKNGGIYTQLDVEWPEGGDRGVITLLGDRIGYTWGHGWGAGYKDFQKFHSLDIARKLGDTTITLLEDLKDVSPSLFDTDALGGSSQSLRTALVSDEELRNALVPGTENFTWPPILDGPLDGVVHTEITLDVNGNVRHIDNPISDNKGLDAAATQGFAGMKFKPIQRNGQSVQALGIIYVRFHTTRPAGVETFKSAREMFVQGNEKNYYCTATNAPYTLTAKIQYSSAKGIQTGEYQDTCLAPDVWKREARINSSRVARSRVHDKYYRLAEGEEQSALQLAMSAIEPIPTADTMTESDWRIRREDLAGQTSIHIMRGPDGPGSNGYWFRNDGTLIQSQSNFFYIPSQWTAWKTSMLPRTFSVLKDGKLGMRITIQQITSTTTQPSDFVLKGHEWQRAFTADTR